MEQRREVIGQEVGNVGDRLEVLAETICEARGHAMAHLEDFAAAVLKAGHAAIEAKELLPHGEYGGWLEQNCNVKERQMRNYVKLAKRGASPEEIVEAGGVRGLLKAILPKSGQNGSAAVLEKPHPLDKPRTRRKGLRVLLAEREADIDTKNLHIDELNRVNDEQKASLVKQESEGHPHLSARIAELEREVAWWKEKCEKLQAELGPHARGAACAVVNTSTHLKNLGTTLDDGAKRQRKGAREPARAQGDIPGFQRGPHTSPYDEGH